MASHTILAAAAAAVLAAATTAACGSPVDGGGSTGASTSVQTTSTPVVSTTATTIPTSGAPTSDQPRTSAPPTKPPPAPGPTAPGSPIDVPTIPDPHITMDGLQDTIRTLFEQACGVDPGAQLCVHLLFTDGDCFVGYSPTGRVERGKTVTVVTESQAECDRANGVTTSEPTDTSTTTPETTTTSAGTGAS